MSNQDKINHIEDVVIAALNHHSVIIAQENLNIEALMLDSLGQIYVILEVEDALGVSIDDETLNGKNYNKIKTVNDFINYVGRLCHE